MRFPGLNKFANRINIFASKNKIFPIFHTHPFRHSRQKKYFSCLELNKKNWRHQTKKFGCLAPRRRRLRPPRLLRPRPPRLPSMRRPRKPNQTNALNVLRGLFPHFDHFGVCCFYLCFDSVAMAPRQSSNLSFHERPKWLVGRNIWGKFFFCNFCSNFS